MAPSSWTARLPNCAAAAGQCLRRVRARSRAHLRAAACRPRGCIASSGAAKTSLSNAPSLLPIHAIHLRSCRRPATAHPVGGLVLTARTTSSPARHLLPPPRKWAQGAYCTAAFEPAPNRPYKAGGAAARALPGLGREAPNSTWLTESHSLHMQIIEMSVKCYRHPGLWSLFPPAASATRWWQASDLLSRRAAAVQSESPAKHASASGLNMFIRIAKW